MIRCHQNATVTDVITLMAEYLDLGHINSTDTRTVIWISEKDDYIDFVHRSATNILHKRILPSEGRI